MTSEALAEILLDAKTIRQRVMEMGQDITRDFQGTEPFIMPVLDGGMIFAADLVREIRLPLTLLPIKASSYGTGTSSSGTVSLPWGVPTAVRGKKILLVDDILDTGRTFEILTSELLKTGASSVKTCTLLRKHSSAHLHADYIGFEIPDQFVVGYGLDLAGKYRNLPCVGIPRNL
jgi:hypoxanthine phosphoribosyltransferase